MFALAAATLILALLLDVLRYLRVHELLSRAVLVLLAELLPSLHVYLAILRLLDALRAVSRDLDRHNAGSGAPPPVPPPLAEHYALAAKAVDDFLHQSLDSYRNSGDADYVERIRYIRPVRATLGSFSLLRRIGKGAYGEVHVARKEDTCSLMALKVIRLERVRSHRAMEHLRLEREALAKVTAARVPFVCTLCHAFAAGPSWLILAVPFYSGGVLEVHLEERAAPPIHRGLPLAEVRFIAAQMVVALDGLHTLRILHRDVKPNNMVLRRDGYYVLADLGLVASLEPSSPRPRGRTGSRGYWAPEVVRKEPQDETADWWSLGVTLAYAASGVHPFRRRPPRPPPPSAADAHGVASQPLPPAPTRANAATTAADDDPNGLLLPKWNEDELNENTLTMPINPSAWGVDDPELADLLARLLTREQSLRLGGSASGGVAALKQHPFLSGIDWEMLEASALPAPFLPDPTLVYAKDHVPPLSENENKRRPSAPPPPEASQQSEEFLAQWDYVSDEREWRNELRELVRKCPDGDPFWN